MYRLLRRGTIVEARDSCRVTVIRKSRVATSIVFRNPWRASGFVGCLTDANSAAQISRGYSDQIFENDMQHNRGSIARDLVKGDRIPDATTKITLASRVASISRTGSRRVTVLVTSSAKIFDSLRLLGPVFFTAKLITQRLWRLKLDRYKLVPTGIHTTRTNYDPRLNLPNDLAFDR